MPLPSFTGRRGRLRAKAAAETWFSGSAGPAVWRRLLTACIWVLGIAACQGVEAAGPGAKRLALVIGNGDYRDAPLANPVRDAQAMGERLRSLGFEVAVYTDLDRRRMREAALEFSRRLQAGGVGLFYFAGHGLQAGGKAWLLPVDADAATPAGLLQAGLDLEEVLAGMSGPRPDKLNLVILDTCRNAPFGAAPAPTPAVPAQTLVAWATAPGSFAADGRRHGLYTAELLKAMAAGLDIREILRRAAAAVRQDTGGRQVPRMASSLTAPFRLGAASEIRPLPAPDMRPREPVAVFASRGILPKDSSEQYELTFWESIKDSTHPEDYEAYLQAYPNGRFAALARVRIARLRAGAPKAETPPAPPAKTPPPKAAPAAPAIKAPAEQQPAAKPAPPSPAAVPAGISEIRDCPTCPILVVLPKGSFTMGSNSGDFSEKPAHPVALKEAFAIGKYEVTVEQWNTCADAGACPRIATDANAAKTSPARDLSWDDARQYVQWLSKTTGKPYRLPTEAEWEYAARGGSSTRYWWGEEMRTGTADCKECGPPWRQDGPVNVGSFAANPYGLYDMNGSVWEWVSDCWHGSYKGAPGDGRSWEDPNCRVRVIRGGSWREGASYMTSSTRFRYDASVRDSQNGFRVARDIK